MSQQEVFESMQKYNRILSEKGIEISLRDVEKQFVSQFGKESFILISECETKTIEKQEFKDFRKKQDMGNHSQFALCIEDGAIVALYCR